MPSGRKEKHFKPIRGERSSKNPSVKPTGERLAYGALPLEVVVRRQLDDWQIGFEKEESADALPLTHLKGEVTSTVLPTNRSGASRTCESAQCRTEDAEHDFVMIVEPRDTQVLPQEYGGSDLLPSGERVENLSPTGLGSGRELSGQRATAGHTTLEQTDSAEEVIFACSQPRESVLQDNTDRVLNSLGAEHKAHIAMLLTQHPADANHIAAENEMPEATCRHALSQPNAEEAQAQKNSVIDEEEKRRAKIAAYKAKLAAASRPQHYVTRELPQKVDRADVEHQVARRQVGASIHRAPESKQAVVAPPRPAVTPSIPAYTSVCQADGTYRVFHKQQDAMAFADACNLALQRLPGREPASCSSARVSGVGQAAGGVLDEGGAQPSTSGFPPEERIKVFALEKQSEGGWYRSFAAASYNALWGRYHAMQPQERHFYEVIREGRPCHLYFDLEFIPSCNAGLDGPHLVDCLLRAVAACLGETWGLDMQQDWVFELDSTTPVKFSRHVVVRIPGAAFADAITAGRFVTLLLQRPQVMDVLRVRKEDGSAALMVDTAVYTRNRHFRIIFSSKGGKSSALLPTQRFALAPGSPLSTREVFLATLVCNVESGARVLTCESRYGTAMAVSAPRQEQVLLNQVATPSGSGISVYWKHDAVDGPCTAPLPGLQQRAEAAISHMEKVGRDLADGATVTVRTVTLMARTAMVAYGLLGPGAHWCENVGRYHKNNYAYLVANFHECLYFQRCYDPDCRDFRSPTMPLPEKFRLDYEER